MKYIKSIFLIGLLVGPIFYWNYSKSSPPADFQTSLLVGSGLNEPTALEFAPDGRLFILERSGNVKIYKNGAVLPEVFATLPALANADRGLLGIDFDPQFNTNHYVYFYFVDSTDGFNKVVRFDASGDVGTNGPVVIYDTQMTQTPAGTNHAGGTVQFGPDGKLYISIGDNGHSANSQNLTNPFGKILRVNKDGTIPSDNPFVSNPNANHAIWAYGLRNPFRFQFDSLNGNMYVGDVGQNSWEEINLIAKGANYGWPLVEGDCGACAYANPVHSYFHTTAGFSITGGPVYRSSVFPEEYQGSLFFGDFAAGFIKRAVLNEDGSVSSVENFEPTAGSVVDMKIGPDGALYYVTIFPGRLFRTGYTLGNQIPIVSASADVQSGEPDLTVNFSSAGSSDAEGEPLTYLWNFGDGTESTEANPSKTYTERGEYLAQLTVSDGVHNSNSPVIRIQVGTPPVLNVSAPTDGQTYRAGDTINYSSSAPGANILLDVFLHHNIHSHPFINNLPGDSGSFVIPQTGESAHDTWYELIFEATDPDGLKTVQSVRIDPLLSIMTFQTDPPGLQIRVDGQPVVHNENITGVEGFHRLLTVPIQSFGGVAYEFDHWSQGGPKTQTLTTPINDTTYTAFFRVVPNFTGQYYSNKFLSGEPTLTREDQGINFNWDRFSPHPSIPNDQFSVRWTKNHFFSFGRYEFTTSTDDGARLYIDGALIINDWNNHGEKANNAVIDLTEGEHEIKMEYYEDGGGAVARLGWDFTLDQPQSPTEEHNVSYYNNVDLSGAPVLTRIEDEIDYVWYMGSPDPAVNPDNFSARWVKTADLDAGNYQFNIVADDGFRLYIDEELVLDKWFDQPATSYILNRDLSDGMHDIVFEYYERGGNAVAKLSWEPTPEAPVPPTEINGFKGEYYKNSNLLGNPALIRDDAQVDFDWGNGSPDAVIPLDQFSARWTKDIIFDAGNYTFSLTGDDGVRLYIDGEQIINGWYDQAFGRYMADKVLTAGVHSVKVEYYENSGQANIKFGYGTSQVGFNAQYYNSIDLSGDPVLERVDEKLDFLFNGTSPDPIVNTSPFSARWTRVQDFEGGEYTFHIQSDDGVRFYVDDELILEDWTPHPLKHYWPTVNLTPGQHTIKIEYFQAGGGGVMVFKQ